MIAETAPPHGVVVMAYGTPSSADEIPAYYTHIRGGRPPTDAQLADLIRRYAALGGTSLLAQRTTEQLRAIEEGLAGLSTLRHRVVLGQKHAAPFIEDAVGALAEQGVRTITGVVLAPHYSASSIGGYHRRAQVAADAAGCSYTPVERWADLDAFLSHQGTALLRSLERAGAKAKVLFTAHSLPERLLVGDPYSDELTTSAAAIARRAGLGPWADWGIAWQSAGRTPEPWRGPDVLAVIDDLAATGRAEAVVVVPQGFVADHLEVAYDLDIEAAARARGHGLRFERADVVNADASVMSALAGRILEVATR